MQNIHQAKTHFFNNVKLESVLDENIDGSFTGACIALGWGWGGGQWWALECLGGASLVSSNHCKALTHTHTAV